jgi:hypothetical protein
MAIKGVFNSDANINGTKKGDFASSVLQIDPTGRAQLLALSAGMPSRDMGDVVTTWFEETHISGRQKVSTGGNSAASTIVVADASSYTVGVILEVQDTAEQIFVTAISGSTLTIERGFGGSTAATIGSSTTYVQRISNANEEGSSRPTAVANIGVPRFNFAQIFRNTWNVSGTAMAVDYITGSVEAKNKRDAGLFHAEDMERAFWWGRKSLGIRNNSPFRTCDGILTQMTTNDVDAGALTNWADVDAFLQTIFQRNIKSKPNERIAFCGNTVLSVLNRLAALNSQITITPGQAEFGLKVMKWLTPYGDISLMTHPLMVENPVWTKDLHVLHPGAVEVRYLRRTDHDPYNSDGSRAGVDADYGVFTTEASISYMAEVTGGSMTGFTAASNT